MNQKKWYNTKNNEFDGDFYWTNHKIGRKPQIKIWEWSIIKEQQIP